MINLLLGSVVTWQFLYFVPDTELTFISANRNQVHSSEGKLKGNMNLCKQQNIKNTWKSLWFWWWLRGRGMFPGLISLQWFRQLL